jgi:hypothetical protein
VRRASITRRRPSLEDRFKAGSGTLVLDDRDGRFNPENTAGAYYPDVTLGVPIRAKITVGANTYPIFYASARAWPPAYPKSQDAFVTVPLIDGFYNLNLTELHDETYVLQDTDDRINDVLDDIGWVAGLRDIGTSLARMQATSFDGDVTALDHILDVAEAEMGVVFMSRDGKVTFRSRVANSGATPSATFTDTNMSELTVAYSDDHIFNDIRVTREDGGTANVINSASITLYGRRVLSKDVMPMSNDPEAWNMARWLVALLAGQRLRIEGLKLEMYNGVAHFEDVLGLELRDYITVTHVPPAGDTIDQDCAIEGIRHEMTPGQWTVYLDVAPLAAVELQEYWELGISDDLGTDTILA